MEILIILLMAADIVSLGYIARTFLRVSGEGADEKD